MSDDLGWDPLLRRSTGGRGSQVLLDNDLGTTPWSWYRKWLTRHCQTTNSKPIQSPGHSKLFKACLKIVSGVHQAVGSICCYRSHVGSVDFHMVELEQASNPVR